MTQKNLTLAHYRPGDFFFSGTQGTVLSHAGDWIHAPLPEALASWNNSPLLLGVLPFDPSLPGYFSYAAEAGISSPTPSNVPLSPEAGPVPAVTAITAEFNQTDYSAAVASALERIHSDVDELEKVVLARSLHLIFASPVPQRELLNRLYQQNPGAFVFASPLPGQSTIVGASPELLLRRTGPRVLSRPLAGSAPRSGDDATDHKRAQDLLQSAKDQREHAFVVEMVADTLAPFCQKLTVPATPSVLRTDTMIHLATGISGELKSPDYSALELAYALQPTPAVCGWPAPEAKQAITALEPRNREFYAGAVGWMNTSGDGEWALSLRCAELFTTQEGEQGARIYAGAGIVAASSPDAEFAETGAKLQTMLRAFGAPPSS